MSSAKERIFNKIHSALTHSTEMPFPEVQNIQSKDIYDVAKEDLTVTFAENFSKVGGQFIYCTDTKERMAKNILPGT